MLLVVLHRAIVRHVLIGQRDCKFVNNSLCNAPLLRCSLLFHTSRLVRVDSVSISLKSTRHTSQLDTWSTRVELTMCQVDSKPSVL